MAYVLCQLRAARALQPVICLLQRSSVPDYPLEDLSPRAFEQLTVALAQKLIGPGVEAFGSGPDGGREATWRGKIQWSRIPECGDSQWDGYTVFQAKQRERLGSPAANTAWLQKQIKAELDAWVRPESNRGQMPTYIIFVTNVNLGSLPNKGIDQINSYISRRLDERTGVNGNGKSLRRRGLKDWKVWHRDQLNGFLSDAPSVRTSFKGLLTVGDVLSMVEASRGNIDPEEFEPFLSAHGAAALKADRWIHFNEAGGDSKHQLTDVFIDLPASTDEDEPQLVLKSLIALSDLVLKPSFLNQELKAHRVLTGQPGGGKSTVSKFFTQVLRAAFLRDQGLSPSAAEVRSATQGTLKRLEMNLPSNRRWPIRIDLAEYATKLGPDGNLSVQRWVAQSITERSDIEVRPATIMRWIRDWPSAVIFDGLDEVTAPEVRTRVLGEIQNFVDACSEADADLLTLITTRPTADRERIDPERFEQTDLALLDLATAIEYGETTTKHRLAEDPEKLRVVLDRFANQVSDQSLLHLLKTPLQVLIVTIILEKYAALPGDRYRLFWQYFQTIYQREASKPTTIAPLLQGYERVIQDIHEIVGLSLHASGESAKDARVAMGQAAFRSAILKRLGQLGHDAGPSTNHLAERIVVATTKRLVLLVPGEGGGVSFEIRSLQELMAARALTRPERADVKANLRATARSPHWRNVWIFAAGRIFADHTDGARDDLIEVVENIDLAPDWPRWLLCVGPELAGSILGDGCTASAPRWQRRLVNVALRALRGPEPTGPQTIGLGLAVAAREDGTTRANIRNALKAASVGQPIEKEIARSILYTRDLQNLIPAIPAQTKVNTSFKPGEDVRIRDLLEPHVASLQLTGSELEGVERALRELSAVSLFFDSVGGLLSWGWRWQGNREALARTLREPGLNDLLGTLFMSLDPEKYWFVPYSVASLARDPLLREPVADQLQGVDIIPV